MRTTSTSLTPTTVASGEPGPHAPTRLLRALTTLGPGFTVSAGWPAGLRVQVNDDCGSPLDQGAVLVAFSNGDPEIALTPLSNGRWDGTWQAMSQAANVTVTIRAESPFGELTGAREVSGNLGLQQEPPFLTTDSVVSSAAFQSYQVLAPGSLVSIFGLRVSEGKAAAEVPLFPTIMASTQVTIAGRLMLLLFTAEGRSTLWCRLTSTSTPATRCSCAGETLTRSPWPSIRQGPSQVSFGWTWHKVRTHLQVHRCEHAAPGES